MSSFLSSSLYYSTIALKNFSRPVPVLDPIEEEPFLLSNYDITTPLLLETMRVYAHKTKRKPGSASRFINPPSYVHALVLLVLPPSFPRSFEELECEDPALETPCFVQLPETKSFSIQRETLEGTPNVVDLHDLLGKGVETHYHKIYSISPCGFTFVNWNKPGPPGPRLAIAVVKFNRNRLEAHAHVHDVEELLRSYTSLMTDPQFEAAYHPYFRTLVTTANSLDGYQAQVLQNAFRPVRALDPGVEEEEEPIPILPALGILEKESETSIPILPPIKSSANTLFHDDDSDYLMGIESPSVSAKSKRKNNGGTASPQAPMVVAKRVKRSSPSQRVPDFNSFYSGFLERRDKNQRPKKHLMQDAQAPASNTTNASSGSSFSQCPFERNPLQLLFAFSLPKHESQKYIAGALANIDAIQRLCTSAEVWIYVEDGVNPDWLKLLKAVNKNLKTGMTIRIELADKKQGGAAKAISRYNAVPAIAEHDQYANSILLFRDVDGVFNQKDLETMQAFARKPDKFFHRYTDSVHGVKWPLLRGGVAVKQPFLKRLGLKSADWHKLMDLFAQTNTAGPFMDQRFILEMYQKLFRCENVKVVDITTISLPKESIGGDSMLSGGLTDPIPAFDETFVPISLQLVSSAKEKPMRPDPVRPTTGGLTLAVRPLKAVVVSGDVKTEHPERDAATLKLVEDMAPVEGAANGQTKWKSCLHRHLPSTKTAFGRRDELLQESSTGARHTWYRCPYPQCTVRVPVPRPDVTPADYRKELIDSCLSYTCHLLFA